MKKIITILLIILMIVMLVVGCVSRQDYDALMAEYDGLRVRVESAESDLAAAQGEIQTLQSDLSAEQSKSAKLETDLSAEQSKSAKLETDLSAEQSKTEKLESDLSAEQSKTAKLETDLSAAQSKVESLEADNTVLKGKTDKAEPCAEILEKFFFVPAETMTGAELAELTVLVDKTDNAEIQKALEEWLDSTTQRELEEHQWEFYKSVWDALYEALYPGGAGA